MVIYVKIDFSFIEENLSTITQPDKQKIQQLTSHDAAKGIYNHAKRYQNTEKNLKDFWNEKLQQESKKGQRHLRHILDSIEYIKHNISDFKKAFKELEAYLPKENDFSCTIFCIIGYDIGVVSDGNAYLNLGHPLFHTNQRELLYFAMHELHHVAYTQLNPTFSFDDIKTTSDLTRIIKYSTHLEGLAVYSSRDRRRKENGYTHRDYVTLNDPVRVSQLSSQFFDILEEYDKISNRALVGDDWGILELMSDGDRLWYVVGAFMAEFIDRCLGRETLNSTMVQGPEAFFKAYYQTRT
jgi:hypothetical protein